MLLRQKYGMSIFSCLFFFFNESKRYLFDARKLKKLLFYCVFYCVLLYFACLVVKV